MNRAKDTFIKTSYAVGLAKNNDNSCAFLRRRKTDNRFPYTVKPAGYTRQNGKLLPFNGIIYTVNDRVSVCASEREIYLVFFVILFKLYKPHILRKTVFCSLLFKFLEASV